MTAIQILLVTSFCSIAAGAVIFVLACKAEKYRVLPIILGTFLFWGGILTIIAGALWYGVISIIFR